MQRASQFNSKVSNQPLEEKKRKQNSRGSSNKECGPERFPFFPVALNFIIGDNLFTLSEVQSPKFRFYNCPLLLYN
jgi:hypothetical protein